jgi:acyl carrier protein
MDNLYQEIKEIIAEELKIPAARLADDLTIEDLGLDSLTLAEILIVLQQKLGKTIQASKLIQQSNRDTCLSSLINNIIQLVTAENGI